MKLTNYHSHTEFCDAHSTIENLVKQAITEEFTHWGVTPHCPLPMLADANWVMSENKVEEYFNEIDRLRNIYGDKIKILRGMEVDYIDDNFNPNSSYFTKMGLDYSIGSVHLLRSPKTGELLDIDCGVEWFAKTVNKHFDGSLEKLVRVYYTAMSRMVEIGGFTFVGHPDKVSANARILSGNIMQKEWYRDVVEEFLQLCARKNIVLEINTKAYKYTQNFFPDECYFKRIKELGISVIINSDTHRIEALQCGLKEAREAFSGDVITLKID